jgi:hypothetical protein
VKQPDDEPFGRLMETMARRSGFQPFLKASNLRPGQDLWREVIEPTVAASHTIVIIWTDKTDWGTGVAREVELARSLGLREVLLLQSGQSQPSLFEDTSIEYERFDEFNPGPHFSRAVSALREAAMNLGEIT